VESDRIKDLKDLYLPVKGTIEARLEEFNEIWEEGTDKDLFRELAFCLLTPQSRARTCWAAIERMVSKSMLTRCGPDKIREELVGVRFSHRKADYICEARGLFAARSIRDVISGFSNPEKAREWLVENIKGLGYKEASHYLRNIGLGENLAILDRHILKNLKLMDVIDEIPTTLNKKNYLEIERKMRAFSEKTGIPMCHLDLLLWYKEAGEVFK
jgi:N-glycosylase/DNA lyase